MKTILKLMLFTFTLLSASIVNAQTTPASNATATVGNQKGLLFSVRAGHDFPTFDNNTPYIKYNGGLTLGASLDYYWSWFGLGADFDRINNYTENTYLFNDIYAVGTGAKFTNFSLSQGNIKRTFFGIGPSFKWQNKKGNFLAELNTRAGLGYISGGSVLLVNNTPNDVLNYHAGYDVSNKFATKAQARFSYFFNDYIGINVGAYYLHHFGSEESTNGSGVSSSYQPLKSAFHPVVKRNVNYYDSPPLERNSCNCNVSSLGVFAGITVKIPLTKKEEKEEKYSLAVTARDKFTKQLIPNTDVAIKNAAGEVIKTGKTNAYGVVVFDEIKPDNYTVEGMLSGNPLELTSVIKDEFKPNTPLQKEIIYSNKDFLLKGNAVVCNTTKGIPGVKVKLQNKAEGIQKSTLTNNNGVYTLHVKQNKVYTLSGQKDSYFSQIETVNTKDFDRNVTLFVKLEVCMEKADCGKALALKNIHYDLDKFFIRADAKPELNRLVNFMKDNPTLKVEVSSHTDSRGSDSYNKSLSQKRANAALDYIVSQGIASERISAVGYGETKLVNECANDVPCSKFKHQMNRRTEMKVICPD